jgi:D-xylose transport system substrate-binding protein
MSLKRQSRTRAWAAIVMLLALVLAACGGDAESDSADSGDSGGGDTGSEATTSEAAAGGGAEGGKIALLLPESKTARYETQDRPNFEAKVSELCPDCEIIYNNADQDASKQQQQAEAALVNGAQVMVLDPVDSASAAAMAEQAKSQDVPVISYDRLITGAELDYYISFDNEKVGTLQGEWIVDNVDEGGTIVMINGAPTDNNAKLFKEGAHSVIDNSSLTVGKEYDTPDWSPDEAQNEMDQAITALGADQINGVYAANDGTAGGAIAAMKGAGIDPLPPATGQDAELAAIQRIVAGEQGMTVYKAIKPEAELAAELAVALLNGEEPQTDVEQTTVNNETMDVPSYLLEPVVVTIDNINDTIIADGFWSVDEICTDQYADACAEAGIQ